MKFTLLICGALAAGTACAAIIHRTIVAKLFGWRLLGAFAVPAWAQVGSITASNDHFCALTTAGAVLC